MPTSKGPTAGEVERPRAGAWGLFSARAPPAQRSAAAHALPGCSAHNVGLLHSHWGYFLGNVSFIQNSVFSELTLH